MNARSLVFGSAGVFVLTLVATPVNITAQQNAAPATHLTYAKDVAPILQRSCQTCHRPGTNRADVAVDLRRRPAVGARHQEPGDAARMMPPWHIERNVGIQKLQGRSVADRRRDRDDRVVGRRRRPEGQRADMPARADIRDDEAWHIGTPDLIVEIPKPHVVPGRRRRPVDRLHFRFRLDRGSLPAGGRGEAGPGRSRVVHHLLTYVIQDIDEDEVLIGRLDDRPTNDEIFLNEYAVGKNGDILPEGTGKLVKAGSKIRFNLHYHPAGKDTADRSRVGMKFYPKGYVPKYHQISLQIANAHAELDIPRSGDAPRRVLSVQHPGAHHGRPDARAQSRQADVPRSDPAEQQHRAAQLHGL